jgi:hypothetical protein
MEAGFKNEKALLTRKTGNCFIASAPITPRAITMQHIFFAGPALDAMKLEKILSVPDSLDEECGKTFISSSL